MIRPISSLRHAESDPAGISDDEALALLSAGGEELGALVPMRFAATPWATRSYVVTRNINFTNVCYTGCRFCSLAQRCFDADAYRLSLEQVGERAAEALARRRDRGLHAGRHPELPGTGYFDLAAEVKRRCADIHMHAFSRMEVVNGAARTDLSIRDWLIAAPRGRSGLAARHRRGDPRR